MPGAPMAPSLGESWSVSPDGLVYDFVLRAGVRFPLPGQRELIGHALPAASLPLPRR